jgi:hypothetical protein
MKAKEFDIKKRDPNWRAMQDIRRSGAGGQHKDKKKAEKQGEVKHKAKQFAEDVSEGSYTTEKQIMTRIRQIMHDRKLSGTESNAGELLRLKQQLKDLRSQQGVQEGSGLMASREYKILEKELDQYQAILKKSREITKSIKYSRVHSEIITEIKMLAEQNKISPEMFDDAISEIFDAASRLESAVYGLEEPIEDRIKNIKNRISELEDEEYYKESNEQQSSCPECGGPLVSESSLSEKQDACYHKVKSRYKVWPSAYASGALVQCRKKGAKNWGNKSK